MRYVAIIIKEALKKIVKDNCMMWLHNELGGIPPYPPSRYYDGLSYFSHIIIIIIISYLQMIMVMNKTTSSCSAWVQMYVVHRL